MTSMTAAQELLKYGRLKTRKLKLKKIALTA